MRLLRPLPDTQTFTEEDYRAVQHWTPPGRFVTFMVCFGHRLGLGDMNQTVDISYLRALNNTDEVLARPETEKHVREYIEKYRSRVKKA